MPATFSEILHHLRGETVVHILKYQEISTISWLNVFGWGGRYYQKSFGFVQIQMIALH